MTETGVNLHRDYKGLLLCELCWDGAHFGHKLNSKGERTSTKFSRCLQGGCECPCREILAEQKAKRKRIA